MDQDKNALCSKCAIALQGDYCFQCGQKYNPRKIGIRSMVSDIVSNIFSLEKSLPADLLRMIKDPSFLPRNYMNGYARFYSSPGKMLLYSLTLMGLHLAFVSPKILGLSLEVNIEENLIPSSMLFFLFFLPLLSTSSYISDYKQLHSKTYHFVTVVYTACTGLILTLVIDDIRILSIPIVSDIYFAFIFIVLSILWTSISLFAHKSWKEIALHFIFNLLTFSSLVSILIWIFN